ncbi:MAG: diguanylate cyclase [Kofleriaceae bacterium]
MRTINAQRSFGPALDLDLHEANEDQLLGVSLLAAEGNAERIRAGLGLDGSALWMRIGGSLRLIDAAGDADRLTLHAERSDLDDRSFLSGTGTSLFHPLMHAGEVVGRLGMWNDAGIPIAREAWRTRVETLCERLGRELVFRISHDRLMVEHDRLRQSAMIDEVTGAWTRAAFDRNLVTSIAAAARRGEPLALVVFDLVGLERINERFGHATGDAVLAHLTTVLRSNVRSTDELGRAGGSEIALLLGNAPEQPAVCVAEKLLGRIADKPLVIGDVSITLQARASVTMVAPTERDGEAAQARAALGLAELGDAVGSVRFVPTTTASPAVRAGQHDGLPPGTVLGGMYRIIHEISRGATGVVYRGEDLVLGRQVAIKLLRSDLAQTPARVAMFRSEAAALAALRHPNLVGVHTAGIENDRVYFVMELIEGMTLWERCRQTDAAHVLDDPAAITATILQVADALGTLHGAGLIHRDVKPENVVLDRSNGRAVLVDVGTAKRYGDRQAGAGTPGFSAPESFAGEPESFATDVYGLAATAYMLLTGVPPFGYAEPYILLARQVEGPPDAPSTHQPDLPEAVDQVILRGLDQSPSARYRSPAAFATALAGALAPLTRRPARSAPLAVRGQITQFHEVHTQPGTLDPTDDPSGMIRGAAIRIAIRAIGVRHGEWFLRRLAESDAQVARLLRPDLPPMSWQSATALAQMIDAAGPASFELGKVVGLGTVVATFAQIWGADPAAAATEDVLAAAPSYWGQYFSGQTIEIESIDAGRVALALVGEPPTGALRGVVVGTLQRIAELSGADDVTVATTEVTEDSWHLEVSWQTQA